MTRLDPGLLDALALRSREQPAAAFDGLIRIDVVDNAATAEQWYLQCVKGVVTVALEGDEPDCVIAGDQATLAAVLSGSANPMAAVLRGALAVGGQYILLVGLRRLFPHGDVVPDVPAAGYAKRLS